MTISFFLLSTIGMPANRTGVVIHHHEPKRFDSLIRKIMSLTISADQRWQSLPQILQRAHFVKNSGRVTTEILKVQHGGANTEMIAVYETNRVFGHRNNVQEMTISVNKLLRELSE